MDKERDTSPLFNLIKPGKGGEKDTEQPTAGTNPAAADAGSNRADEEGLDADIKARNLSPLSTRGGELTLKYDLAMLVLLALAGMVVIAYMWGHYSGREVGREEMRDIVGKSAEPTPREGEPGKREGTTGLVAKDFYSLRIMSDPPGFSVERRTQYEKLIAKYKLYEPEIVIGSDGGIILYVGRYSDKNGEEAGKAFAYFRDKPEFRSCKWEIRQRG